MPRCPRMLSVPILAAALASLWMTPVPPARAAEPQPARRAAAAAAQGPVVDVNAATEAELTAVPGIGKTLARRIVEFRDKNGPFQRVDDLLKVQGIGEKSLQKIRPHLTAGKTR